MKVYFHSLRAPQFEALLIIGSEGEKKIYFLFNRANQFQASLIIKNNDTKS